MKYLLWRHFHHEFHQRLSAVGCLDRTGANQSQARGDGWLYLLHPSLDAVVSGDSDESGMEVSASS